MMIKRLILTVLALSFAYVLPAQFRDGASYEDLYDGETVAMLNRT